MKHDAYAPQQMTDAAAAPCSPSEASPEGGALAETPRAAAPAEASSAAASATSSEALSAGSDATAPPEGPQSEFARFYNSVPGYIVWIVVIFGLPDVVALLYGEPIFLLELLLWAWLALQYDIPGDSAAYPRVLLWPASVYLLVYIPPAQKVLEWFEPYLLKYLLIPNNSLLSAALSLALIASLLAAGATLLRTRSIGRTARAGLCAFLFCQGIFPVMVGCYVLYALGGPH